MKVKAAIAAGALALSGVAAALPAHAALSQCGTDKMCVWGNNDYEWLIASQIHGQGSWLDPFDNSVDEDNQQDSWANRSVTYTGCLADDVDGGGDRITMAKNSKDPNLAYFNSDSSDAMRTKNGC